MRTRAELIAAVVVIALLAAEPFLTPLIHLDLSIVTEVLGTTLAVGTGLAVGAVVGEAASSSSSSSSS